MDGELISLLEFQERWNSLFDHDQSRIIPISQQHEDESRDISAVDLFDCSSLKIHPRVPQLNEIVASFVDQWKAIDERKIQTSFVESDSLTTNRQENCAESRPSWYEKHVRLPRGFDYASRNNEAPVDDGTGERVVSLEDPTEHSSYELALWKLFHSIPLASQVEKETVSGHKLASTQAALQKVSEGKATDTETLQSLSQIRMNDRHGIPPPLAVSHQQARPDQFVPALVLECWRELPRCRGVNPDPDRMVLEFAGYQTLLDVHRVIEELSQDELWWGQVNEEDQIDPAEIRESDAPPGESSEKLPDSSGLFFIEGIFYTTGSVDYVSNIQAWLAKGTTREKAARWQSIGLDSQNGTFPPPPIKTMVSTQLQDIKLRLGVRYVHICHGDVECFIYATDRKLVDKSVGHCNRKYPIIHDIWTSTGSNPECEACKLRLGTFVTSTVCDITLGRRILCRFCAEQLSLFQKYPDQIRKCNEWHS